VSPTHFAGAPRHSGWALGFLAALALFAIWEAFLITDRAQTRGCGGNFSQYFTSGAIICQGEVRRLYDQSYFQHLQESLRDDPLPSIYPPTVGLVVAPLTRLAYKNALIVWWAIHAVCILATGAIFYRTLELPRPWRINALAALAALLPLWIAVGIGQLTPMFLLVLAGGLALHRRGSPVLAGLVLSALALKPQLAAGLVLWMVLRRDGRTLLGLAAGFAAQAAAVAAFMGPGAWLDYFHALPAISAMTRRTHFSPMVEASFVGIAGNLASSAGLTSWEAPAMKLAYAASVSFALVMLCRVVWSRRPLHARMTNVECRMPNSRPSTFDILHSTLDSEYACGVMFMTIVPPYLIVYDQALLAVAMMMLWSSPRWRWGVALFAAMTAVAANLSLVLGFSITGFAVLALMFALARSQSPLPATADRSFGSCEDSHSPLSGRRARPA
jgi:hypothetical protein